MANIALITNNVLSDSGTAITSLVSGSGTTNYLSKFTGSTALGNSLVYDDGTNVGIGTTSPGEKLDVNGNIRLSNNNPSVISYTSYSSNIFTIKAQQTSGLDIGGMIINTGSGESRFGSFRVGGGYYTTFFVNNSELIRLSTSNNVLIGSTTDAGYKLDVNGTIRSSSTVYGVNVANTNNNPVIGSDGSNIYLGSNQLYRIVFTSNNINLNPSNGSSTIAAMSASSSNGGSVLIGANGAPSGILEVRGSITASSAIARSTYITSTLTAAANNDVLVGLDINNTFTNGSFTGVSNLALRTAGIVAINSGLGAVGTYALSVSGSSSTLFSIRGYGDANLAATLYLGGYNGSSYISSGNLSMYSGVGTGNAFINFIHNNGNVAFKILSNSVIQMNPSAGNVLIGTTTDSGYKLDVIGDSRIKGSGSTSGTTTFRVENSSGGSAFTILGDGTVNMGFNASLTYNMSARGYGSNGGYGAVGVYLYSQNYGNAAGTAATIQYSGSPAGVTSNGLVIGGGFALQSATYNALAVNSSWTGLGTNTLVGYLFDPTLDATFPAANIISIKTTKGNVQLATTSGNVLIGTTTDGGYKLSVNGSGNFNLGNSGYIRLQSGSGQRHGYIQSAYSNFLFSNNIYFDGSNWRYDQNGYGAQIQTETLSVGVIAFNTFASGTGGNVATIIESMRIVNNGNILMGTTSDSGHKLQVQGDTNLNGALTVSATSYLYGPVIQQQPYNTNAVGSITSFIDQDELKNNYYDGTYHGETIYGTLATTVYPGQIVFLRPSAPLWDLATASSSGAAATNLVGIACANGNYGDTITILLRGFFASNSWYSMNYNYGVPMYLSTSSGQATTTAPSSSGNVVRILGHVDEYSNGNGCVVIRFNPDNSWLVI